jgi:hypothetical protein
MRPPIEQQEGEFFEVAASFGLFRDITPFSFSLNPQKLLSFSLVTAWCHIVATSLFNKYVGVNC